MIMISKQMIIIIILILISIVNGSRYNYNCHQYENRVYQLTVTFPDKEPLYCALRLQTHGMFDELFSIAGGNNAAELGSSFALSNRVGYYKCLAGNKMHLTGLGYLYKTEDVEFLKENGAVVIHDYSFRFHNNGKKLTGQVKFAVFKNGENPFTTNDKPVFVGDIGQVKGELLKYREYYKL
ncbi:unnamed protein product [Adineta steineri]|uniref:Uncharacterized protein n=1 Tax=Adineta steineri TaxID=433720 RepID=A0A815Y1M4_9BILA|nr:unnamed protein product [Adineta steineri]CAF1666509.1 unnamed protein product [Adineta steineri]